MPFPLAKLGYLAVKQISKPLARSIKEKAKTSPFLRNYILLPPAQLYHFWECTFKMRLMGFRRVTEVAPLNEQMAVDQAAEILGEVVIYSVGAGIIFWEYRRQERNNRSKEDTQNDRLGSLEEEVKEMGIQLEVQSAQLREMNRQLLGLHVADRKTTTIKDSSGSATLIVSNT
ncbi:hypothetical protein CAPTEDRAFT_210501 [Capitella teleta]|uniref:Optic atrophy 3 protein n=1 Tax=Capitella teleta TaxID=283909 RepID=R7VEG4_CAPTE|nr:hypothetical protein CAPTEDRAFT_210501 [Capitella teleta]|eukprot:ELU17213.1 hypothetical protein CAPTEDRAFT_210501 [Capitella teleta]